MNNREADRNSHPPACTCVDCNNQRLARYRSPTILQILRKLGLNLLVLITLALLIWSSVKAFGHQWTPSIGSSLVIIALILFILSSVLFNKSIYRKPSMKLTAFCLTVLFLVTAFSGVEPMSMAKDKAVSWLKTQTRGIKLPAIIKPMGIVGKWQDTRSSDNYMEFFNDKRLVLGSGGIIVTGTYELIGEEYMKVYLEGLAGGWAAMTGQDTLKYLISNDILTITIAGKTTTYKRIRTM